MVQTVTFRNILWVFPAVLAMFFLGGCQQNASVTLYQGVAVTDLAVHTTGTLLTARSINAATAQKVYNVLYAAQQAAITVNTDLSAPPNTSTNIIADTASLMQALTNVENELAGVQTAQAKGGTLKAGPPLAKATANNVSVGSIVSIIAIVLQLEPSIASFVDSVFGQTTVTPAQLNTALADLNTDLAALQAQITAATTAPAAGS